MTRDIDSMWIDALLEGQIWNEEEDHRRNCSLSNAHPKYLLIEEEVALTWSVEPGVEARISVVHILSTSVKLN